MVTQYKTKFQTHKSCAICFWQKFKMKISKNMFLGVSLFLLVQCYVYIRIFFKFPWLQFGKAKRSELIGRFDTNDSKLEEALTKSYQRRAVFQTANYQLRNSLRHEHAHEVTFDQDNDLNIKVDSEEIPQDNRGGIFRQNGGLSMKLNSEEVLRNAHKETFDQNGEMKVDRNFTVCGSTDKNFGGKLIQGKWSAGYWTIPSNGVIMRYSKKITLVIIGAYYDNRTENHTGNLIRLFTVSDVPMKYYENFTCLLWYNESKKQVQGEITLAAFVERKIHVVNKKYYYQIGFTCKTSQGVPIIKDDLPDYVSLTDPFCKGSQKIRIIYPENGSGSLIGVCVNILYGEMNPREAKALVEWFELNRLFGVNEINMYNATAKVTLETKLVLDYYEKLGLLKLHWFPPPVDSWDDGDVYDASHMLMVSCLGDCLMRNVNRYAGALALDFDEILVPSLGLTYRKMLTQLDRSRTTQGYYRAGYLIETANIYLDFPPSPSQPNFRDDQKLTVVENSQKFPNNGSSDDLIISKYTRYIPGPGGRYKPFVFPKRCAVMWNHGCLELVKSPKIFKAKTARHEEALVYHFRRTCSAMFKNSTAKTYVEKKRLQCQERLRRYKTQSHQSALTTFIPLMHGRVGAILQELGLMNSPTY